MEQSSLPSNSLMNQTVEKKKEEIKPVISGKTKRKGKSFGEKIVDNFVNQDVEDVKGYLVQDVLIPTVKRTVINIIEMFFYGRTGGSAGKSDLVSMPYYKMSTGRTYMMGSSTLTQPKKTFKRSFDDIWFENRGDLEIVVDNLNMIMGTYHMVTVADLLELSGQPAEYTDNRFGWTDLSALQIAHSGGGYVLKMPPPRPID